MPTSTVDFRVGHFIGGQYVDSADGRTFEVINPATEEKVADAPAGSAADVDNAVKAARAAQDTWGATTGKQRAVVLRAIAEGLRKRVSTLGKLESMDMGKPLVESEGDIGDAANCFDFYAGMAEKLDDRQGQLVDVEDSDFAGRLFYELIGCVGAITPWNFPLLMAVWKVAPALAAGCCMVLKPSEYAPLTCMQLGEVVNEAGLPAGALNVVLGTGIEAGLPLSHHPDVDKLAFTGSFATGSKVMGAAAERACNCTLELGGKSPMVIFDDADIANAVEWAMFGIFFNSGQVCSATSRVLVHESIADKFYATLKEQTAKIVVGDPLTNEASPQMGPIVSKPQYDRVKGYIESGLAEGATLLAGGKSPSSTGYFVQPTIFTNVQPNMRIWREEIFGPVMSCMTFQDEAEALRLANDSEYGLAASVISNDPQRCQRFARGYKAGIVWVNCSQPTFNQLPWGGVKKSGVGRELGEWGLDNFLEVKQVVEYATTKPWGWYNQLPESKCGF